MIFCAMILTLLVEATAKVNSQIVLHDVDVQKSWHDAEKMIL